MIKKTLTVILIAGAFNTGCSIVGERFSDFQILNQNISTETTKVMLYNFISPRREPVAPQSFSNGSSEPTASPKYLTYFSASGLKCRIKSSGHTRPVCFVNNSWQETAPIFNSKTP